tara:strand:+ start:74 stop:997 length:924 start_codon:yes stop_codon:yes gene_type:complete
MKKIFYLLFSLIFLLKVEAQKKKNGIIYNEHPYIAAAKEFNSAFINGNKEEITSLVAEDVKLWNSMSTNKKQKAVGLNGLLNRSAYWSNKLKAYSIKPKGKAYPDALEFKGNNTWVYTYEILKGIDKENGFKIETPIDRSFLFNKDGKISWILESFNTAHLEKYNNSFKKRTNGTIWIDHPYIGSIRRLMNNFGIGEIDTAYKEHDPNARIYDINMKIGEFQTIDERREWEKGVFENFDLISIDESGYPDLLEYNGDGMTVLSWWIMTFKDKRNSKNIELYLHRSDTVNEEGKIINTILYYNGQLLK